MKNNFKKFPTPIQLFNLIKNRRSIRKFKNIPIKKEDILELIEAGIFAPSGSNTQCYRFIVITNKQDIEFLANKKLKAINNAKAVILIIADLKACSYLKSKRAEVFDKLPYQDCSIAMANISLLAEAKGIANCIIHLSEKWYSATEIGDRFNLGYQYELQGLIMLGYADEIVDYETATHAGKPIKRDKIERYIVDWRE